MGYLPPEKKLYTNKKLYALPCSHCYCSNGSMHLICLLYIQSIYNIHRRCTRERIPKSFVWLAYIVLYFYLAADTAHHTTRSMGKQTNARQKKDENKRRSSSLPVFDPYCSVTLANNRWPLLPIQ